MNNQITFASGLKEYISMALQIWPALQLCLRNLQDSVKPTKDSLLPQKNYNSMTSQQFIEEITEGLHTYVMEHDVKAEHIEQYLVDILIIFNTEEFMSRELEGLIGDMQQQRYQRLFQLRELYSQMKNVTLQHQQQGNSEDQQNSDEEPQEFEGEISQEVPNYQKQEQAPQLTQQQKQELEDDGWCVVPSKKKRK